MGGGSEVDLGGFWEQITLARIPAGLGLVRGCWTLLVNGKVLKLSRFRLGTTRFARVITSSITPTEEMVRKGLEELSVHFAPNKTEQSTERP